MKKLDLRFRTCFREHKAQKKNEQLLRRSYISNIKQIFEQMKVFFYEQQSQETAEMSWANVLTHFWCHCQPCKPTLSWVLSHDAKKSFQEDSA